MNPRWIRAASGAASLAAWPGLAQLHTLDPELRLRTIGFVGMHVEHRHVDRIGKLQQEASSLGSGQLPPSREGSGRRVDGAINIVSSRFGHLGDHRAVVRVDDLDGRAAHGVDELAADEQLITHQKSTGYTLALPVRIISGSSGEAFSHTSNIERFAL